MLSLATAQDHKYACYISKTVPRDNHVKYWVSIRPYFLKQQSCVSVCTKIHFVVVLLLLFFNSASNFQSVFRSGLSNFGFVNLTILNLAMKKFS